jgi:hypothetical protein
MHRAEALFPRGRHDAVNQLGDDSEYSPTHSHRGDLHADISYLEKPQRPTTEAAAAQCVPNNSYSICLHMCLSNQINETRRIVQGSGKAVPSIVLAGSAKGTLTRPLLADSELRC